MTFSIVALDPETGEIGAAAATCWPAIGAAVPWLEAGVGVVVTQAATNVDLGPQGLRLLREGHRAPEVLERLVAGDPGRARRQLGVIDASGLTAAHTGGECVAEAGHLCASGVSIQANMLERADAWTAMSEAFRGEAGDLAERLLAALRAADHEGGDIRGRRSAVLLVAPGGTDERPWARRFDLRVDASSRPLDELARALSLKRAYEHISSAIDAATEGDHTLALERSSEAHSLAAGDAQVLLWHALVLALNGRDDDARSIYALAVGHEPRLAEFAHRYVQTDHGAAFGEALRSIRLR